MQNTDKRGALKNSSKDNTYKKKIDSAKSKPDSAVRSPEFTKGNHSKNLSKGKSHGGAYMGDPGVTPADYTYKEKSCFDTQHQSDVNKGGWWKGGPKQSTLYKGSNLSKNNARGKNQSTYYKGNTLNVRNMTSEVEGQGV